MAALGAALVRCGCGALSAGAYECVSSQLYFQKSTLYLLSSSTDHHCPFRQRELVLQKGQ